MRPTIRKRRERRGNVCRRGRSAHVGRRSDHGPSRATLTTTPRKRRQRPARRGRSLATISWRGADIAAALFHAPVLVSVDVHRSTERIACESSGRARIYRASPPEGISA
ncbi:hypothetical protein MRX96_041439 [Rhipicephalus microplus]